MDKPHEMSQEERECFFCEPEPCVRQLGFIRRLESGSTILTCIKRCVRHNGDTTAKDAKAEFDKLVRLAKLGETAERIIDKQSCSFSEKFCNPSVVDCVCYEFCKLRAQKGGGE